MVQMIPVYVRSIHNQKIDEGYSTSYIRKMHQMLNQAFNQAVKWKKIKNNPVVNADPPSVKNEEMRIWSIEEINSFLNQCRDERHYITFILAIYTGMRRGEILGLKWTDIDITQKVIHVQRSLAYFPNHGYIFTSVKTKGSNRHVPIPDKILHELVAHKEQQQKWKEQLGDLYKDQDLVVCTEKGTMQDPRNVIRVMKRICTAGNVTPIRFHDIRHTHARFLSLKE